MKAAAGVASGIGATSTTVSAENDQWSVYSDYVEDSRAVTQSLGSSTMYKDAYDQLYTGSLSAAVRASDWVTTGTEPLIYIRDIKTCSTAGAEDDDGVGQVTRTQQTANWDESVPSNWIDANTSSNYIGGYDGEMRDSDVNNITETIAKASISALGSTAVAFATSYPGSAIVASIVFALLTNANTGQSSYNRVWDWDRTRQTSYWTRYRAEIPAGETLSFDQADRVDMYLTNDTMFDGFATTLTPPSGNSIELNESFSSLSDASYSKQSVLKLKDELKFAFSGWYAKQNPDEFPLDESKIEELRDDSVVLRIPSTLDVRATEQDPADLV